MYIKVNTNSKASSFSYVTGYVILKMEDLGFNDSDIDELEKDDIEDLEQLDDFEDIDELEDFVEKVPQIVKYVTYEVFKGKRSRDSEISTENCRTYTYSEI